MFFAAIVDTLLDVTIPDSNIQKPAAIHITKKPITKKRKEDVPADSEKWKKVENKLSYLSEKPGKGD